MEKESMDEFPADYSDGYDMAPLDENVHQVYYYFADFDSLGVQSIYRGGGEEHRSNIVWISYGKATGVKTPVAGTASAVVAEEYYDVAGRRLERPAKGLVIKKVRYADGTVKVTKVMAR